MSVSVQIGLLLSLATAFASVLGFLYKHRGAIAMPTVDMAKPLRTSFALFKNPWYTLGILTATAGWGFHVGALALAPISLVQATIAGGLVLLTVTADRLFAHEVTRREWFGVGLAALGLAFLAATIGDTASEAHSDYENSRLVPFLVIVTCAALVVAWRAPGSVREGVLFGVSAGLFWAASDTAIKALSDGLGEESAAEILLTPLAVLIALASIAGLVVSARSLQVGKAVPVIALTSVAANTLTIAAGPIVFEEPLPDDPLGVVLRMMAFVLVISAAALTPAPVSAAEKLEAAEAT
ncbi:MAG TPA: DMT family transporter [Solirubrobacterales bacterium]|nr:DMT family transporter [Solirubrobacterales bacterium]